MGQDGDWQREASVRVLKAVSRVEVSTSKSGAWSDGGNVWVRLRTVTQRKMQRESWLGTVSRIGIIFCPLWATVSSCLCYGKMMVEDGDRPCIGSWGRKNRGKLRKKACFVAAVKCIRVMRLLHHASHQPARPNATFGSKCLPGFWGPSMRVKKWQWALSGAPGHSSFSALWRPEGCPHLASKRSFDLRTVPSGFPFPGDSEGCTPVLGGHRGSFCWRQWLLNQACKVFPITCKFF